MKEKWILLTVGIVIVLAIIVNQQFSITASEWDYVHHEQCLDCDKNEEDIQFCAEVSVPFFFGFSNLDISQPEYLCNNNDYNTGRDGYECTQVTISFNGQTYIVDGNDNELDFEFMTVLYHLEAEFDDEVLDDFKHTAYIKFDRDAIKIIEEDFPKKIAVNDFVTQNVVVDNQMLPGVGLFIEDKITRTFFFNEKFE